MKIAIDGPAGVGKTSVGRALAEVFGCRFISTGSMYRVVAVAFDRGMALDGVRIDVSDDGRFLLNGEDITDLLHTPEYDEKSSQVATRPAVRSRLVELQRELAARNDVVMEGRDIGTVVLPDADVKLFLQASPAIRADRRLKQRGAGDREATLKEIRRRDRRDKGRAVAPLKPARDATIIDTDRKTLVEVISVASNLVREQLGKRCHGG